MNATATAILAAIGSLILVSSVVAKEKNAQVTEPKDHARLPTDGTTRVRQALEERMALLEKVGILQRLDVGGLHEYVMCVASGESPSDCQPSPVAFSELARGDALERVAASESRETSYVLNMMTKDLRRRESHPALCRREALLAFAALLESGRCRSQTSKIRRVRARHKEYTQPWLRDALEDKSQEAPIATAFDLPFDVPPYDAQHHDKVTCSGEKYRLETAVSTYRRNEQVLGHAVGWITLRKKSGTRWVDATCGTDN